MSSKIDLREEINYEEDRNSSAEEQFQNKTLRPVLKLQNHLILELFKTFILESKNTFYQLSEEKKELFIINSLQKNIVLRNKYIGLVIGLFTKSEFAEYNKHIRLYNKRIMVLMIERIRSQMHQFQNQP